MPTDDQIEDVRLAIYRTLASTGLAPTFAELSAATKLDEASVEKALTALHSNRDIVVREGRIVMAHPFATIPLGFSVMSTETLWWGGCVWDSFAIPHLLGLDTPVLVATTCPACDAPHAWSIGREAPPEGSQVAHFLTPVAHIWDDVVRTCANQRVFCDEACVSSWLVATGHERGYLTDLATVWRLARGWYAGRLERGYRRREPSQAAEYFREVGLVGPFWD